MLSDATVAAANGKRTPGERRRSENPGMDPSAMSAPMTRDVYAFAIRIAVQEVLRKARRSLAALLGIAAGLVLVLILLGFQSALYDSSVRLHRNFAGEAVVAPANFRSATDGAWFSAERLSVARSAASVESVAPLYWDQVPLENADDGTRQGVLLIGIDVRRPAVDLVAIGADVGRLRTRGQVLFDTKSLPMFGNVTGQLRLSGQRAIAIPIAGAAQQPSATVIGTYALGGTATVAGTMLTGAETFAGITGRPLDRVSLGVVKLKVGGDIAGALRELRSILPPDLKVYTKSEFVALERSFWKTRSPIGFLFDLGALIGFLVCGICISQILFQIVEENRPQYALLKSMGYPPGFFAVMVGATALILALTALPVALAIADAVYRICMLATQLDIRSTVARAVLIAAVTIVVALVSALAASRRLDRADPAVLL
jgi:putative ABC transport system permease protein